jgi:hypothetical protein
MACHDSFGSFIPNLGDLDSRLGGSRDTFHERLIFQIFWKIRAEEARLN